MAALFGPQSRYIWPIFSGTPIKHIRKSIQYSHDLFKCKDQVPFSNTYIKGLFQLRLNLLNKIHIAYTLLCNPFKATIGWDDSTFCGQIWNHIVLCVRSIENKLLKLSITYECMVDKTAVTIGETVLKSIEDIQNWIKILFENRNKFKNDWTRIYIIVENVNNSNSDGTSTNDKAVRIMKPILKHLLGHSNCFRHDFSSYHLHMK